MSADLRLVVDDVEASITGDGSQLTVTTDDAPRFLTHVATANRATGRGSLRLATSTIASILDDAALSVSVVGAHGQVLRIGAGCESRLAKAVLGTGRAEFGTPRDLLGTAVRLVSPAATRTRVAGLIGGLTIAGVVVAISSRRRAD